ncbi:MAG: hypothetical protein Salg2KO_23110 [Salibacteraceae bacterium]
MKDALWIYNTDQEDRLEEQQNEPIGDVGDPESSESSDLEEMDVEAVVEQIQEDLEMVSMYEG